MKKPNPFVALYFLAIVFFIAAPDLLMADAPDGKHYKLVWQDEFDGDKLDTTKWSYRLGQRRDAVWVKENVVVGSGLLKLKTTTVDGKVLQGSIGTASSFRQRFGYYEIRCKLTKNKGHWPGFWLQSPRISRYPQDPAFCGTEIDIFEYFWPREDVFSGNLHWAGYEQQHCTIGYNYKFKGISEGFHTFGLEWLPDRYIYYIDGQKVFERFGNVSQIPQFVYITDECKINMWKKAGNIPADYVMEDEDFDIDWVRIYQIAPNEPPVPEYKNSKEESNLQFVLTAVETDLKGHQLLAQDPRNLAEVLKMEETDCAVLNPLYLERKVPQNNIELPVSKNRKGYASIDLKIDIADEITYFDKLGINYRPDGQRLPFEWNNSPDTFVNDNEKVRKTSETKTAMEPGMIYNSVSQKVRFPVIPDCWVALPTVQAENVDGKIRYHWWFYHLSSSKGIQDIK